MQIGNDSAKPEERDKGAINHAPTGWRVRPYREEDMHGLLALYSDVFGRERTEEEFRWKLLGPGTAIDTVWVAESADGEIIGQHAGIPMRLKLGDSIVTAMHAVEAMSHRDFRREGMLTRLGGGLYGRWQEQGVPLIIGLPHEGWGSRAYALGYRQAFPMRWLSRPLRPLSIVLSKVQSRMSKVQSSGSKVQGPRFRVQSPKSEAEGWTLDLQDIQVLRHEFAGPDFDELWSDIGGAYSNAVVRDARWVQWRYLDAPTAPYSLLLASRKGRPTGYIAYRTVTSGARRIGRIADIFARPNDTQTTRALVREAISDLRRSGADSVVVLVAVGSLLYSTMRAQGFLFNRGEYKVAFIRLSEAIDAQTINDPGKWLLTGGDFDVV